MLNILLVGLIAAVALIVVYLICAAAYRAARRAIETYMEFRGKRVVVCPESRKHVAVEVDALHAAATATEDEMELRLRSCTRWPERADCGQECVHQIANAPEECAVRTMLARFYEAHNSCVVCHRGIGELRWDEHKPALMRPADRRTFEWRDVPAETLPQVLDTYLPVCFDCHVVESFRLEHPELVTERDSKSAVARV